jgi:hypothetical protein
MVSGRERTGFHQSSFLKVQKVQWAWKMGLREPTLSEIMMPMRGSSFPVALWIGPNLGTVGNQLGSEVIAHEIFYVDRA